MSKTVGVVFWEIVNSWNNSTKYSYLISDADFARAEKGDVVMVSVNGRLEMPHIVELHAKPCKKATKQCKLVRTIESPAEMDYFFKMMGPGEMTYGIPPGWAKRKAAWAFAEKLWELAKRHSRTGCCFENPASTLWTRIGRPQYIQPHNFGHRELKKTGLKLDRLPPLVHTNEVGPPPAAGTPERKAWEKVWRMGKSPTRKRDRSESYRGIMAAMADQWGNLQQRSE